MNLKYNECGQPELTGWLALCLFLTASNDRSGSEHHHVDRPPVGLLCCWSVSFTQKVGVWGIQHDLEKSLARHQMNCCQGRGQSVTGVRLELLVHLDRVTHASRVHA